MTATPVARGRTTDREDQDMHPDMLRARGTGGTVGADGQILSDPPDLHHHPDLDHYPEPSGDRPDADQQPAAGGEGQPTQ